MKLFYFFILSSFLFLLACTKTKNKQLPILGRHEYIETSTGTDTVFHTIKDFAFWDQDSSLITNTTFENKIYVSDFFFTSCPSICPVMKVQMLRIYEKYKDNPNVGILSHTIDPEYDNIKVLKEYASRLDVKSDKWHFVTGIKDSIYSIAQTSYYIGVRDDGSFEHSGKFVLVDTHRRIRGIYDGTDEEAVDKLLNEMDLLLQN